MNDSSPAKCEASQWSIQHDWTTIPQSGINQGNGRTHGVCVLRDSRVVIFHQANPGVLIYSAKGELLDAWGDFPGAHGLTLVNRGDDECLWLTDESTKRVVLTTLVGEIISEITQPKHSAYREQPYVPTWVACNEERHGGNGDVWVADGYGASLVHRFDADGSYLSTLDGFEGAGKFACPHGISFVMSDAGLELWVADRGNKRFQIYDTEGRFQRALGGDFLTSPDVAVPAIIGGCCVLLVPELVAGLSILSTNGGLIERIGFQHDADQLSGWPNERAHLKNGRFNSPHSAAADAAGNVFVVEWIIGGRITKICPALAPK